MHIDSIGFSEQLELSQHFFRKSKSGEYVIDSNDSLKLIVMYEPNPYTVGKDYQQAEIYINSVSSGVITLAIESDIINEENTIFHPEIFMAKNDYYGYSGNFKIRKSAIGKSVFINHNPPDSLGYCIFPKTNLKILSCNDNFPLVFKYRRKFPISPDTAKVNLDYKSSAIRKCYDEYYAHYMSVIDLNSLSRKDIYSIIDSIKQQSRIDALKKMDHKLYKKIESLYSFGYKDTIFDIVGIQGYSYHRMKESSYFDLIYYEKSNIKHLSMFIKDPLNETSFQLSKNTACTFLLYNETDSIIFTKKFYFTK